MTTVTLVYPYFRPSSDKSIFRFPPLGLGYIAAYLRQHGVSVSLVDCTFLSQEQALRKIKQSNPRIIGVYSMFTMKTKALQLAQLLRKNCELLVAGGPLPTSDPESFMQHFDVVAIGEGEEIILDLVHAVENGADLSKVRGIGFHAKDKAETRFTAPRQFIRNLDEIPFPARDLFDNQAYKEYFSRNYGYTTTSVITSRGCPFNCDFCSRPVFGNEFRTRSAMDIVDEMEAVQALGYDRIWFADDCFTLSRRRLLDICDEIMARRLRIGWECLSRVDTIDKQVTTRMKQAGCVRVFFGIESGNDKVLALMKKQITTKQARKAVHVAKQAGIQVGAFFIIGYPSETDQTILDTVKFASSLPLDYLSFTLPYPIPGTPLYDRVKNSITDFDWEEPRNPHLTKHKLLYRSAFSEAKLKFAILKATIQFNMRKHLGDTVYRVIGAIFERLTDVVFRFLK